jgi:hypothetical protein
VGPKEQVGVDDAEEHQGEVAAVEAVDDRHPVPFQPGLIQVDQGAGPEQHGEEAAHGPLPEDLGGGPDGEVEGAWRAEQGRQGIGPVGHAEGPDPNPEDAEDGESP